MSIDRRHETEELWLRDLMGTARRLAGHGEIPPEAVAGLRAAAAVLAAASTPPRPPEVSEYYRVSWTERTVEMRTAYVTAAELATIARTPLSDRLPQQVRSDDAASIAALIDDPLGYDLDNALADLAVQDEGDLDEFDRLDIEITPVTEMQMHYHGHYPKPQQCLTCGALCHWTGAGYVHTDDGTFGRGLPPAQAAPQLLAAHAAGQPVQDFDVADYDPSPVLTGVPYTPRDDPDDT